MPPNMEPPAPAPPLATPARLKWAAGLAYLAAWAMLPVEGDVPWWAVQPELRHPAGWLAMLNFQSVVFGGLLAAAPGAWLWRGRLLRRGLHGPRVFGGQGRGGTAGWSQSRICHAGCAASVGLLSLAASACVGARFGDLPPAYHDEYSYLFQAQTFLSGQTAFASPPLPRLFDQMHVLNEGHFASRYFPGTGVWVAPFAAMGRPIWGHWLAGALAAVCVFYTGCELAGLGAGLLAGVLTALSPGMALFSNLLLAHHPTVFGLSLFTLACFRMRRGSGMVWALVAGCGLSGAMLCRPMTAAGFALPFGIDLLRWACTRSTATGEVVHCARRFALIGLMALPLAAALTALYAYNRSITGNGWLTPYQQYLEIYTPRHGFGFNNVVRGERHLGPRVLDNYDRWAENLTWPLAVQNVEHRWLASWQWTLGEVPLAWACVAGLVLWAAMPRGSRLVLAGIVSLHAVHVPYWYDGIMHWHYVFESGPLWALWLAIVVVRLESAWRSEHRQTGIFWQRSLIACAIGLNWVSWTGGWQSRVDRGVQELRFARETYGRFRDLVQHATAGRKSLVLVEADPADRHIDFVNNRPDLQANILIGRYLPNQVSFEEVRRQFPDRALYLYRAKTRQLMSLRPNTP